MMANRTRLIVGAKFVLAVVTLFFLSSMGGAMAVGAPILIPLHWAAAKAANRWTRGGWIFLAALSTSEAMWIYT
jgi:hypothetical protein